MTPKEVFDDGIKTYLIMKKQMFSAEAPVFYVKDGKNLNLVNYRIKDNKIIIDRIFKEGVLKLGKKSIKIKNLKSEQGGKMDHNEETEERSEKKEKRFTLNPGVNVKNLKKFYF